MKKTDDFKLVGHLQVLDEPLSSLYSDISNGQFFLFVRIFEDNDDQTYILSEVRPSEVIEYIDGKIGLSRLFSLNNAFYYKHRSKMKRRDFKPIQVREAINLLQEDGLEDKFDDTLSCRSMAIKNYLLSV